MEFGEVFVNAMDGIKPRQLPVPSRSLEELVDVTRAGEIVKFEDRDPENASLFALSLADWAERFRDCPIQTHQVSGKILAKLERFFTRLKLRESSRIPLFEEWQSGEPVTAPSQDTDAFAHAIDETFGGSRAISVAECLRLFEAYKDRLDWRPPWGSLPTLAEWRTRIASLECYGVANVRRFPGFRYRLPEATRAWAEVFNFLWFGPSLGGLHFDQFDNLLIQLHGRKTVIIYSPRDTEAVDGGHYVTKISDLYFLSPESLALHEHLSEIPFHIVELHPGEGVVIPSHAYHGAFATTCDSISLNSFLCPHPNEGPFPAIRTESADWYSQYIDVRRSYPATGDYLRLGPYQFF